MQREDFNTAAWKRFEKHLNERLAALRELNDYAAHNELKTSSIRGQIAEVKRLLALSKGSVSEPEQPGEGWPAQSAG